MKASLKRPFAIAIAVVALPTLCGCVTATSPNLPAPVAGSWGDATQAAPAPPQDRDWWRRIGDPTLDHLIALAMADSPDLDAAAARVAQAEGRMRASGASLWPQAGVGGQVSGRRIPPEVAERLDGLDPDIGQAQLQLQGSWELDFWGKAASAAQADAYGYLSAAQAYQAARTSLIGQIATVYADLCILDQRLVQARHIQADRGRLLALARTRHDAGAADVSEPNAAEAALAQQDGAVASLESKHAQTRHALALLAGLTDEALAPVLAVSGATPAAPRSPDAALPNDLLRNRPDVMQAEFAALAQYARLESARAGLYPSFSLSGGLGTSATTIGDGDLGDLFNWDKRLVSGALAVSMPLFNRGQLVAQVDIQDAGFAEAVATYEAAVLSAQRDVLDALVQDAAARRAAARAADRLSASRNQTNLATLRQQVGAALQSDRLEARIAEASAADAEIQARGDALKAWISLNRALGQGARSELPASGTADAAPTALSPDASRP